MPEKDLMETMERLTIQLKGAPLKNFEKIQLKEAFDASTGDIFDRAWAAVTDVLHTYPEYIQEKKEVISDVEELVKEVKQAAESYSSK